MQTTCVNCNFPVDCDGTKAIYPGSFDPLTNGHLDLIKRGSNIFDALIVAILVNPKKTYMFDVYDRIKMIERCIHVHKLTNVAVSYFSGLLVDAAKEVGATAVLRGMRAMSDFEYEFQLALMNRKLNKDIETVFMMPGMRWIFTSSSLVKEAFSVGADVEDLVPPHVHKALMEKTK